MRHPRGEEEARALTKSVTTFPRKFTGACTPMLLPFGYRDEFSYK